MQNSVRRLIPADWRLARPSGQLSRIKPAIFNGYLAPPGFHLRACALRLPDVTVLQRISPSGRAWTNLHILKKNSLQAQGFPKETVSHR